MAKTALQAQRVKAGYKSAREFADSIGMNLSTYTKYEQGSRGLSLEQAWEFADALKCRLDDLVEDEDRTPSRVEYALISFDANDSDDSKERLDRAYEMLNDDSRKLLADLAESIACDSSRLR